MPSKATNDATRNEWQELGFFYSQDVPTRVWRFVGSRTGLLRFAALLENYATDPRNKMISEHEHYGPYMYLKVMTSLEPGIDDHSIHGPLADLQQLGRIVEDKLQTATSGHIVELGKEYAANTDWLLRFEVKEEGCDPAEYDEALRQDTT